MIRLQASVLFLVMMVATALAQENTGPVGIVPEPCPPAIPMPAAAADILTALFMEPRTLAPEDFGQLGANADFAAYIAAVNANAIQDWPRLCRFRAANDDLMARGITPRIVFMGDSITENWTLGDPDYFNDNHVNRGISAQTTPHMLLRFRNDVIDLDPQIVHILAGTNDVAGNTGPSRPQDFRNNIMSMVELARAHGIQVILGSIPPAAQFNWAPALQPAPRIRELNSWLRQYADDFGLAYIDYFSALAGPDGELRADLGNDGVHPNRDGYVIMRRLLDAQLATMAD